MDFVTVLAVVSVGAVLLGVRNHFDQFCLLDELRWLIQQDDSGTVACRAGWTIIFPAFIDLIFTERDAFVLGMTGLATPFVFLPFVLFIFL